MTNDECPRVLRFSNRQRARRVNTALLRRITLFAIETELKVSEFELCFHLVAATEMARVNEQFLQHTGSTDVITFDLGDGAPASGPAASLHGEVFISIPDAIAQAKEFNTSWQSELARYVIHALLHLCGFDDLEPKARREMKREENRLMKVVERKFPLPELARANPGARKS